MYCSGDVSGQVRVCSISGVSKTVKRSLGVDLVLGIAVIEIWSYFAILSRSECRMS